MTDFERVECKHYGENSPFQTTTPSDIAVNMDECKDLERHLSNGSVCYIGDDKAFNGEATTISKKATKGKANGAGQLINGHQNGDVYRGGKHVEDIELAPATSFWTSEADGAVKIRLGDTQSTSRRPQTVAQFLERAVRLAPSKTALGVKRDGKWLKWTYKEYYDGVRAAAKSFIKVSFFQSYSLLNI